MYNELLKKIENVVKQGQKIKEIKEIDASVIAYMSLNIMNIMNIIDIDFNRQINYETKKEQLIIKIILQMNDYKCYFTCSLNKNYVYNILFQVIWIA